MSAHLHREVHDGDVGIVEHVERVRLAVVQVLERHLAELEAREAARRTAPN